MDISVVFPYMGEGQSGKWECVKQDFGVLKAIKSPKIEAINNRSSSVL